MGQASAFCSGPEQGGWFRGVAGTAFNPWAGTVLANFQCGPGTEVFSAEGDDWRRMRRLVVTALNSNHLQRYFEVIKRNGLAE